MRRLLVVGVSITAVVTWLGWAMLPYIMPRLGATWNPEVFGQWGDAFGALNALFSALAFVAVLYTLHQQQKQIDEAATDQHLQRFERTFYELLRLLREARDDVEFRYSDEYKGSSPKTESDHRSRVTGTQAFKRAQFEVKYWLDIRTAEQGDLPEDVVRDIYLKCVLDRYESTFAPYYRLLYTILLRIKADPKLTEEEKCRYGNLLRSQLTSHEVALCCYNGLSSVSGSFRTLLTEFRIAKYLPKQFGRDRLELYYPSTAFEGRDALPNPKKISNSAA